MFTELPCFPFQRSAQSRFTKIKTGETSRFCLLKFSLPFILACLILKLEAANPLEAELVPEVPVGATALKVKVNNRFMITKDYF
ncbi:hypothetical protein [Vampirovibrio sp.]|uniref:hypothetical protein n=1 Tax=Vampirovibrio sp. TaxID=2717857 RepID=UPI0035947769